MFPLSMQNHRPNSNSIIIINLIIRVSHTPVLKHDETRRDETFVLGGGTEQAEEVITHAASLNEHMVKCHNEAHHFLSFSLKVSPNIWCGMETFHNAILCITVQPMVW